MKLYVHIYLVLLIILAAAFPNEGLSTDLMKKICDKAHNKDLCGSIIKSHKETGLQGLASITLNIAYSHALRIHKKISELIKKSSSQSKEEKALQTCFRSFNSVLDDIKGPATMALRTKSYDDVNDYVGGAADKSVYCDDAFIEEKLVSPISVMDKVFFQICEIELIMINILGNITTA
ncbi:hypothetical protein ACFE04_014339 [Oxalis oulophora]